MKCARCGIERRRHGTHPSACHRWEEPAPLALRALTAALDKLLR